MKTAVAIGGLALAALAASPAAAAPATENVVERGVIMHVSARPPLSGTIRTFAIINVWVADAIAYVMFIPYGDPDQFMPPVNSVCRIRFYYEAFHGPFAGPTDYNRPLMIVDRIDCNTGRWNSDSRDTSVVTVPQP